MLARLPPHRPDGALGHFHRQRLEFGGHRVVPSVEVTEQGDRSDDLDDLAVVEVLLQRVEVGLRGFVRLLRGFQRQPDGGALGRGE